MEQKDTIEIKEDYDIKVEGTPFTFEGGAIRYKKDKGRFDLIPTNVYARLIEFMNSPTLTKLEKYDTPFNNLLYSLSMDDEWHYIRLIYLMIKYQYCDDTISMNQACLNMLFDLAKHFQKGAEKYGDHNCEKGITLESFTDSGRRHMCQWLAGKSDEPHHISAIWNFWMAEWSCLKQKG